MKNPQVKDGKKFYRNKEGSLHRKAGPAVVNEELGWEVWCINGKLHREDGPAVIGETGILYWCKNGKLHKEDGPAIIYPNGDKKYCIEGKTLELTDRVFKKICKPTMENIERYINDTDEDTQDAAYDWFQENATGGGEDDEYTENGNDEDDESI